MTCDSEMDYSASSDNGKKTLIFGVLPSREEFEEAFEQVTNRCCICGEDRTHPSQRGDHARGARSGCHSYPNGTPRTPAAAPLGRFYFRNDPRVGTCELTCSELWKELERAQDQWERADSIYSITAGSDGYAAGQWCSSVLSILGFEWIEAHLNRKSAGHIAFWREWEFFEVLGEVYKALRSASLTDMRNGVYSRHGRWECSRKHFDHFRSVIMPD